MAIFHDRVKDTSTSTGTGSFTLSGTAPARFIDFAAVCPIGTPFHYCIEHDTLNEWETGKGYLSVSTTLVRDTVLEGSGGVGVATNFSAGTKTVFLVAPSAFCSSVSFGRSYLKSRGLAML